MENQLAADIKSGEDAENRDQSELVEPDINYFGVNGYVRLLVGCLNYLLALITCWALHSGLILVYLYQALT